MDTLVSFLSDYLVHGESGWVGMGWLFGVSFLLGISHTFGPGHGKSLLLGVLVADSRRLGHAVAMSLVIGLTHMADVIVLSLVSIFIVTTLSLGSLSLYLGWISGLGITTLGLYRIASVVKGWLTGCRLSPSDGGEEHPAHHGHRGIVPGGGSENRSLHSRDHREKQNLMTAFLYSLAPCPGAWILFMTCLGLGRPVYGVLLLVGFMAGLLLTVNILAVSIVYSLAVFESWFPDWLHRLLQLMSGVVVTALGGWMLYDASRWSQTSTFHSH